LAHIEPDRDIWRHCSGRAPRPRGWRIGLFLREADDNQVEGLIGSRTYRVRRAEVRPA
jgi:hypothetical protein